MNATEMTPQRPTHRIASILAVSALALGLSACGKTEDATVGQRMDSTPQTTEQSAAVDTRTDAATTANADSTMQNAQNNMEQATADAGSATRDAMDTAKSKVDDATITAKVNASLAQDPDLSALRINVDTVDGKVTLDGPAPTTVARDRAEQIAKNVEGVTAVNNQLVVSSS